MIIKKEIQTKTQNDEKILLWHLTPNNERIVNSNLLFF